MEKKCQRNEIEINKLKDQEKVAEREHRQKM